MLDPLCKTTQRRRDPRALFLEGLSPAGLMIYKEVRVLPKAEHAR